MSTIQAVRHEGEVVVKTTIEIQGVTFVNVPATTCYCGQRERVYEGGVLDVAEVIANRALQAANGSALTIDYNQINPLLINEIQHELQDQHEEWLASQPKRRNRTGLSHEQLEAILLAAMDKPDLSIPDCRTLVTTQ
ncbi:MAG: hypothetical protein ACYCYO_01510 [Bacilli bacterium]